MLIEVPCIRCEQSGMGVKNKHVLGYLARARTLVPKLRNPDRVDPPPSVEGHLHLASSPELARSIHYYVCTSMVHPTVNDITGKAVFPLLPEAENE